MIGVGIMWLCGLVDVHSEVINGNSQVLFMVVRVKRGLNDSLETNDINFVSFHVYFGVLFDFCCFLCEIGLSLLD